MKMPFAFAALLLLPGCIELGLGGDSGATGDTGETSSSGDSTTASYAMTGTLTSNSCGTAVGAVESFQNTASVVVEGSDMTLSVGETVTAGDYEDDAFDVSGSSAVDLAAMTGLQGTACELVRTDRLEGKFDGFGADTFDAKLTVHYEPNDIALCTELLVNTWDAPFKAIPCDVDYDVSGKKQ